MKIRNNLTITTVFFLLITISSCNSNNADDDKKNDGLIPEVTSTIPADNSGEVAVNSSITATFNIDMNAASINASTFYITGNNSQVSGTCQYNSSTKTAVFTPSVNISYETSYRVTLNSSIEAENGNRLSADYTWNFSTGIEQDTIPPEISSKSPENGVTDVDRGIIVTVTFSEDINPATINESIFTLSNGGPVSGSVSYNTATRTATFDPDDFYLNDGTQYTATISGSVEDLAGNQLGNDETWTFTTEVDEIAPAVISKTPDDASTDVVRNVVISVTFSEYINPDSLDNTTFSLNDGSPVAGTVSYDSDTKTAVFNPAAFYLNDNTLHTVTLSGTVEDYAENPIGVNTIWSFTTEVDIDAPVIITHTPSTGAADAAIDTEISATFSEYMDPLTIDGTKFTLSDGSPVAGTVSYTAGSLTARFIPDENLEYNTEYTVTVSGSIEDYTDKPLGSDLVWSFRTLVDILNPTVVSTSPETDAVNVSLDSVIEATFSESIGPGTINESSFTVDNGVTASSIVYNPDTLTATFTPLSDFTLGTTHTATITTDVQDPQGNFMEENYTWSFQTVPLTPYVVSTIPGDGALNADVLSISAAFNKELDETTVTTSNFQVREDGTNLISGTVGYDATTDTITFTPDGNLNYETSYAVTITTDIKDSSGNNMESEETWTFTTKDRYWTIMFYMDGDNDLEVYLLGDITEMKNGYIDNLGLDIILIMDRIGGYSSDSSILGEDFTDTRMYRINNGYAARIAGGTQYPEITVSSNHEANMGDALTLKKFIDSCKIQYPADNYALILSNHGNGPSKKSGSFINIYDKTKSRAICQDITDEDILYTAEITDILTSGESVDLLGFDACLMGSIEVAYQYRPGNGGFDSGVMVASPPVLIVDGWKYDNIFERIKEGGGDNGGADTIVGGLELYYAPSTMTALQLGGIIVEEQRDSTQSDATQSLACYNLSNVNSVKTAVDTLSVSVSLNTNNEKTYFENIRGSGTSPITMHYFYSSDEDEWRFYPFFDLYDLCERTSNSSNFLSPIPENAAAVMTEVESFIVYSYAGSDYTGYSGAFQNRKNGVHIFFPDGDRLYYENPDWYPHWAYQWWYNSIDTNIDYGTDFLYGKLDWCIDDATPDNSIAENWFEMLDSWFDTSNDSSGGLNGYQY